MEDRKSFYLGVKPCGCVTASLVDDEMTSAKDVANFAKDMHKTGRKMRHAEMTEAEFAAVFKRCKCMTANAK